MDERKRFHPALVGAPLLLLAGCGFSPVYAPLASGAPGSDLREVYVAVIPDRPGQLLREALKVRLEGAEPAAARRYTLRVSYALSSEAIGIDPDSTSSFTRYRASASWSLLSAVPGAPPLATGTANAQDGYSVIVNQYFYSDLQTLAVDRRLADNIANQIVLRLASYFRDRARQAGG